MLFIKDLNQDDSGRYICRGTYANNEEMETEVVISTFSKFYCSAFYDIVAIIVSSIYLTHSFDFFSPKIVGITWEDAPEDQYAVIHKDSKIRCVVKARPAATVDWLKESLIISTGKHSFTFSR